MPKFDPPYPGESLREDVLPAIAMTTAQLAKRLDYPQEQLAAVLSGHVPVTIEIAQKLEAAGPGSARQYLAEQAAFDKWQAP